MPALPIESARGPYGGYRVGRRLRLPPLLFSATEALGLVMAVLDGHHSPSDPDDPARSALGKIIRALPGRSPHRPRPFDDGGRRPRRSPARPDPTIATRLVQAC